MRILVVRFSAIGDCVMCTWPLTALKASLPNAEVTWAMESRCAAIAAPSLTNRLVLFPREEWKARPHSPSVWLSQIRTYLGLRRFEFDVGIDLQGHSKTALCLRLSRTRRRWATRATDHFAARINPILEVPNGLHEVEWHAAGFSPLGEFPLPQRPWMPPPRSIARNSEKLITVQIGAGQARKRYPREAWQVVVRELLSRGFEVAVLGAGLDWPLHIDGAIDLVGKTDLRTTLDWVAASQVHICGDTGTAHAAAGYGVPVVALFGPTDPARFRPYASRVTSLRAGEQVAMISTNQVVDAACTWIESNARVH